MTKVKVIGGGLAGCEAAWQIANAGFKVQLYEMRPNKMTPAHHTGDFAELVCSNSLRSNQLENAVGLLKEELRMLNSLIMESADKNSVPAGGALAVDREKFSVYITDKIKFHPNIEVINDEVTQIAEDEYIIIATGPLTSDKFSQSIREYLGEEYLYFYDAAAPIVTFDSINMDIAYKASRYDKGEADYVNCPMNKDEYENFYKELIGAETAELKCFEKETVFEGCMPVETMASRGQMTLLFGPLKPVGLLNPRTGEQPYAVVQLRQDNSEGTLYNIVGFQTHLKWSEQKRVFSLIPGLENAEFARYGVMHRNTFINSPKVLKNTLQTLSNPKLMFAGQVNGVEGYVESTSSGMVAGINMSRIFQGKEPIEFPKSTAHGSLCNYITDRTIKNFQPMNVNFGIFEPLKTKYKNKQEKNREYSRIALGKMDSIIKSFLIC